MARQPTAERPSVREHDEHSRARLIEAFAETGRIDAACEIAGVGRTCHYEWMQKYPEYAAQIQFTRTGPAKDKLLDKATERALGGESDRLLEFLIKGLDPAMFGDRMRAELSGAGGGAIQTRHEIVFVSPEDS